MSGYVNRRQFVKNVVGSSVGLGATAALGGCASMDRFFGLEKSRFDEEVIIVGGGAAGLAAAYEFKKAHVPFRLFEASSRIGGRVYTLENFNEEGQAGELGAEYFEESHKLIFDYCKDLNLPVDTVSFPQNLERQLVFSRQKLWTGKELAPRLQKLSTELIRVKLRLVGDRNEVVTALNQHEFPHAPVFDRMSIEELLKTMQGKIDSDALKIFDISCAAQFGRPTGQISALHLLNSIDLEAKSEVGLFRVRLGNQRLVRTLYERVSGVLPNFYVKLDSPLVEIEEVDTYFRCHFRTPQGHRRFESRHVILALPINQYRNVKGFRDMKLGSGKLECLQKIEMAHHSKAILGYKQRFWQKKLDGMPAYRGSVLKENYRLLTSDGSAGQNGERGLLSVLMDGKNGPGTAGLFAEELIKELSVFGRSFRSEFDGQAQMLNWSKKVFQEGSFALYRPGEFLSYHGLWNQPDYDGRLAYAGEHCPPVLYGTWVGALQSGQAAALSIIQKVKPKNAKR